MGKFEDSMVGRVDKLKHSLSGYKLRKDEIENELNRDRELADGCGECYHCPHHESVGLDDEQVEELQSELNRIDDMIATTRKDIVRLSNHLRANGVTVA